MFSNNSTMTISQKNDVTIRDIYRGYVNDHECEANAGVFAYDKKLCIRPEYQRSFVYNTAQSTAVIETILLNRPLGLMYWCHNQNDTYDVLDGQQRTISICDFAAGYTSIKLSWLNDGKNLNIDTLTHKYPKLAEAFWNYPLMIQICEHGTKDEILKWFTTINIQGAALSSQELRNVNYTGAWLTNAKHYFSKSTSKGTCPAEKYGGDFTNKDACRQNLLEQVLAWITDSKKDVDICEYMEAHYKDNDAKMLWNYYCSVIDWVKEIFPAMDKRHSKTIDWGILYNKYKENDYDPDEMTEIFNKMLAAKESGELVNMTVKKIVEYCFDRDRKMLTPRKFTDNQRIVLYNRQNHTCGDCGEYFEISDLNAHHIISWWNGGLTELDNGIMLCNKCHNKRHYS